MEYKTRTLTPPDKQKIRKQAYKAAGSLRNWISKYERQAFIKGYVKAMEVVYAL